MWPFELFWGWTAGAPVVRTAVRINYPAESRRNTILARDSNLIAADSRTNTPENAP